MDSKKFNIIFFIFERFGLTRSLKASSVKFIFVNLSFSLKTCVTRGEFISWADGIEKEQENSIRFFLVLF